LRHLAAVREVERREKAGDQGTHLDGLFRLGLALKLLEICDVSEDGHTDCYLRRLRRRQRRWRRVAADGHSSARQQDREKSSANHVLSSEGGRILSRRDLGARGSACKQR